ncbi:MAG: site-2 protease family protein, partial [Thermoplasmata archaeon]|nr:site-2 protease family protein [Thermoplasmata archaeon]
MNGYILALLILILYSIFLLFLYLKKKEALEERGITFYGPFLMVRTLRGRSLLDRLAGDGSGRTRLWRLYGDISIFLVMATMVIMFSLLLWQATFVANIPKERAPSPALYIGVPGINPIIPLWYGIIGLAVGIVVHEVAHGILTRVGGIKVKSMGLLFFIFPLGAFVEPDEDELKAAERRKRMRVYSVGPSTNLIFA